MTDGVLVTIAVYSIFFVAALGLGALVATGIEKLRPGTLDRFFGNDAGLFKK